MVSSSLDHYYSDYDRYDELLLSYPLHIRSALPNCATLRKIVILKNTTVVCFSIIIILA